MVQSDESRHISNSGALACLIPPDLREHLGGEEFWSQFDEAAARSRDTQHETVGGVSIRLSCGWDRLPDSHSLFFGFLALIKAADSADPERTWPCMVGLDDHSYNEHQFTLTGTASGSRGHLRVLPAYMLDDEDLSWEQAALLAGVEPDRLRNTFNTDARWANAMALHQIQQCAVLSAGSGQPPAYEHPDPSRSVMVYSALMPFSAVQGQLDLEVTETSGRLIYAVPRQLYAATNFNKIDSMLARNDPDALRLARQLLHSSEHVPAATLEKAAAVVQSHEAA